jgi:hypothetical protein
MPKQQSMKASETEDTMATMALPICELERSVSVEAEKARTETERVLRYSTASRADILTACKVLVASLCLKWLFSALVRNQDRLIRVYQSGDFMNASDEQLLGLARSLRDIVRKERTMVTKAGSLGVETRVWWDASLRRIAEQAEHLDSIAESLEVECDPEASLLLAMALDKFTAHDAKPKDAAEVCLTR